ncbi:MAG: bifunctional diaminohydroxyphosphoribosylaminopyrimidine deaminase/5-amino-6-(5-phosphoribosylamino)uracil reductase RibD, partial [Candidatus Weimeria sp.]
GSRDQNPLVHGKGVLFLKENGIEVVEDFLREECDELNAVFFHYITTRTPYVVMKCAESLDGKTATVTGESKYISCEESRLAVMHMRNRYKAIMIGIGTALADDPMLTCRLKEGNARNPIRIICDKNLRLPPESNLVRTADEVSTIIACSKEASDEAADILEKKGVTVIRCPLKDDEIDLSFLMKKLGEMEIDGILLEGGRTLNASMLEAGLVNEVHLFIAPVIFGGRAKTIVEGRGVEKLQDAFHFKIRSVEKSGSDLHLICAQ